MAFVVLFGYALARPASESLFLEAHGSAALPRAWIAVAIAIVLVVGIYNRIAATRELRTLMFGAICASAISLFAILALHRTGAWSSFALYVWKDVHVVVLLECLWSFANVIFSTASARWSYGLFCACGSLGGISGNLTVGLLAKTLGTIAPLWLLLFVFGVEALLAVWLAHVSGRPRPATVSSVGFGDALRLLRSSQYLPHLVLLIGVVQLVVNLIDYQFNAVVEHAYHDVDTRTAMISRVYAIIDGSSLALQLSTGIVLRAIGLRATLVAIPLVLGAALGSFALVPTFLSVAVLKVTSKVLDYSLFRAAKEMLYIPLRYEDKTRGKAIVDMLTYRLAKGGASVVLAATIPFGAVGITLGVLLGAWLAISIPLLARYHRLTD